MLKAVQSYSSIYYFKSSIEIWIVKFHFIYDIHGEWVSIYQMRISNYCSPTRQQKLLTDLI